MNIKQNKTKRFPLVISAALVACSLVSSETVAAKGLENDVRILSASKGIQKVGVTIDGIAQTFAQPALLIDGATLVPMRGVFQALGATIAWDQTTQTVTGSKGETIIKLTVGQNVAYVNGNKVTLATKAQVINGSTLVPLRFVSESLKATVLWDNAANTALITSNASSTIGGTTFSEKVQNDWNSGAVDPVISGNVKTAVSKLTNGNLLKDVTQIPENGYTMYAKYYGGPYYIKARLKGYMTVPKNSNLYNCVFR